jgi:hypothetical protein
MGIIFRSWRRVSNKRVAYGEEECDEAVIGTALPYKIDCDGKTMC